MADIDPIAALFARAALRDQAAFAQLYQHCCARLYAVALRIVRRHDWAEEILQESFVNIWNHMGEYSAQKSAPLTWMTAIVRNRALDWLRRPAAEQADEHYEVMVESLADPGHGPEASLGAARDARRLSECLGTLSAAQRQAITLAYLHGLSHGELADHLREPLGTVKTWVRRGLEKLRGCMEGAA